jgi:hypothetical protein
MERRLGGVLTTCARRRTTDGSMSLAEVSQSTVEISTQSSFSTKFREKNDRELSFFKNAFYPTELKRFMILKGNFDFF